MAITTKAIIKADWLNSTDTTADAAIDNAILAVSKEIEGICNQPIDVTAVTLEFEGNGSNVVPLYYTSPVTVTTLKYRTLPTDSWTTVSDCTAFIRNGLYSLYLEDCFSEAYYQAVLSIGYTTIPYDIQLCANEMVVELYNATQFAGQVNRFGVSAINESEGGVSFAKTIASMRERARPRLAKYTRVLI